jgi:hypothetical protein
LFQSGVEKVGLAGEQGDERIVGRLDHGGVAVGPRSARRADEVCLADALDRVVGVVHRGADDREGPGRENRAALLGAGQRVVAGISVEQNFVPFENHVGGQEGPRFEGLEGKMGSRPEVGP